MELTSYEKCIESVPGFMISAENARLLKKSEYKSFVKEIVGTLISINEMIFNKIVFGENESIIYSFMTPLKDFSNVIIEILRNLGYAVEVVHISNVPEFNYKTYSLTVSIKQIN